MKWKWWIRSENEDDDETNNTKRSSDQLKSDMGWSHINNEHNDEKDNDPKLLREGHSSCSQNIQSESSHTNSHQQTYSIKWSSDINIHILNDREYYTHVLFIFLFHFYFLFFIFIFILFFYIYTNGHALNANKEASKMR